MSRRLLAASRAVARFWDLWDEIDIINNSTSCRWLFGRNTSGQALGAPPNGHLLVLSGYYVRVNMMIWILQVVFLISMDVNALASS